jgi:hypothetical protein
MNYLVVGCFIPPPSRYDLTGIIAGRVENLKPTKRNNPVNYSAGK